MSNMEKPRSHKWISLKHVRKFTVDQLKRNKYRNGAISSTSNVALVPAASSNEHYDNQINAFNSDPIFRDNFRRTDYWPIASSGALRPTQHKRRLLGKRQNIDVVGDCVELKNMANDTSNETKPLTQPALAIKPKVQPKYDIHRDVLSHEVVIKETGYGARDKSIIYGLRKCWQTWSFLSLFTGIIPIVQWLPKYNLKRDILGDIIAGVTVAIMNIPHGMAYGLLAGVSPGNGLYMAIFPVLVYMVLGTSKHISIGTFAVVSLMTLKVVQTYAGDEYSQARGMEPITAEQVVTVLAFTVGIVHLLMGLFRLGTLAALLSDPLVNGFTTGAAVHVITSQLKDVFGVALPRHKGAFKIIYTFVDLFKTILQTNLATLLFCCCVIVFMALANEVLKPWLRKRCSFPFPAELIAVIGGTLISDLLLVNQNYGVKLVGVIPRGLPMPELPRFELIPTVAMDSIAIAVVSYSIVMSMGLTFAKKHAYEVRPNQELFALGVGNLAGGCFSCIPMACSLSRSVIQEQAGGVTQVASLVSALLVTMTLLWAGPFFGSLPRCVLAGVIIVALKPMFMQAKQLGTFFKQGKLELLTWISTFAAVVIIDIDIGLLIGVCVSLLNFYIKGVKPYSALLGVLPGTEAVYVDISHHRNAVEVPEIRIFRYTGALNFATSSYYRKALYTALGIDSKKIRRPSYARISSAAGGENGHLNPFRCLVLDFSMLGHMDVAGCHMISDIMTDMRALDVRLFLASPTDRVYDTIVHSMALGEGPFEIFPTLHDAVLYASACRQA